MNEQNTVLATCNGCGLLTEYCRCLAPPKNKVNENNVFSYLREEFPYGHPSFLPISLKEMQLHSDKNHDYAKGGAALGNFDRVAAILAMYPNLKLSDRRVVAFVYALKQVDAVLWGLNSNIEHKVEGMNARLQDISVYAKLVQCMNEEIGNNTWGRP